VIKQDQMIIEPGVTNWASLEGQMLDITVHRMYDALGNEQNSPITWTALINKNDVCHGLLIKPMMFWKL
jgi:hypothetical protein